MDQINIIKIGGNVIDDEKNLHQFLQNLSKLNKKFILVHGGGKVATDLGRQMGIEPKMIDGRRITDAETLQLVIMVYGGLINKKLTAQLQSFGVNAIGMTGVDGNIISAVRRPLKNDIDYGFVGDIQHVAGEKLFNLLKLGFVPICAPLTHNGSGQILNTNADTIASAISVSLAGLTDVNLIYCFELKGVLSNFEDKNSVIPELDHQSYQDLKAQGIIAKGMIPKLDNSFDAIKAGVKKVVICQADDLLKIINTSETAGTTLKL
ncbi:MAG: acetylglutamate kinase [Bacteroidota bacterium]|nr:acetylglutamate kinase [Bacteroidota bacterium]